MSMLLFQVPRDKRLLSVNKVSDSQEDQDKRYIILKQHGKIFTGCIYERRGLAWDILSCLQKTKQNTMKGDC